MYISSTTYVQMMVSAANALENDKERINELNVFPVPDGDTGVNMSMTMSPLRSDLSSLTGNLGEVSKKIASLMLRSARGNSGVILSLFFRGVSKGFEGLDKADCMQISKAFEKGVAEAYKAIQNPIEGTILTVMKASALVAGSESESCEQMFAYMTSSAKNALDRTPEMLPVLKQANVVDAGGAGFVTILNGMLSAIRNEPVELNKVQTSSKADFTSFDSEDIEFPYCTECIVAKSEEYIGEDKAPEFRSFVMSAGNSAVFVDDAEIIKVHVHTKDPGKVLSEAVKYGMLQTVKIENMRLQHSELFEQQKNDEVHVAPAEKKFGFVTVTMGDGIKDTFEGLGADTYVYGGQTMNPSTDQILKAVRETPSEIVFVFPNNSNICMVAKQAAELCEEKIAVVIPSKSVPQGLAAMLVFDEELSVEENTANMTEALTSVKTLEMTFAAHDSKFDGRDIKEGQILGLVEHKVKYVDDNCQQGMDNLVEYMRGASYVTLFYGNGVNEEEAEAIQERLCEQLGEDTEVTIINGGQPLYYYVISVE